MIEGKLYKGEGQSACYERFVERFMELGVQSPDTALQYEMDFLVQRLPYIGLCAVRC